MRLQLLKRKTLGNLRELKIVQDCIDFASNDYLGIARSTHAIPIKNLGSTGSRLLTGNSIEAQCLEDQIAKFHGYEAGLLFGCGYMANVGLLTALTGSEDAIFFDAKVHASIRDGLRLSQAQAFPFRHNRLEHLESRLKNCRIRKERFICVESIYSTDGSIAPLKEIASLAKMFEAHLIVDEAHAVGVRGPNGRGLVAEQGLTSQVFAQVCTFGKALGTYGAIILGSQRLKQLLLNFANSCIYTTALPFYALEAIKYSYDLFPKLEAERRQLCTLIDRFRQALPTLSQTHIQPISFKSNHAVKQMSSRLKQKGLDVRPLMSPTVQRGHEILRICFHAFNTEEELSLLIRSLDHV